jgi:hypothetical protein
MIELSRTGTEAKQRTGRCRIGLWTPDETLLLSVRILPNSLLSAALRPTKFLKGFHNHFPLSPKNIACFRSLQIIVISFSGIPGLSLDAITITPLLSDNFLKSSGILDAASPIISKFRSTASFVLESAS